MGLRRVCVLSTLIGVGVALVAPGQALASHVVTATLSMQPTSPTAGVDRYDPSEASYDVPLTISASSSQPCSDWGYEIDYTYSGIGSGRRHHTTGFLTIGPTDQSHVNYTLTLYPGETLVVSAKAGCSIGLDNAVTRTNSVSANVPQLACSGGVSSVRGSVTMLGDPVASGDRIWQNDQFETKGGSALTSTLPGGSSIRLGANSVLSAGGNWCQSGYAGKKLLVDLYLGGLLSAHVPRQKKGARFRVRFPGASVLTAGPATFTVSFKSTTFNGHIRVTAGSVTVAGSKTVKVKAHHCFDTNKRRKPYHC